MRTTKHDTGVFLRTTLHLPSFASYTCTIKNWRVLQQTSTWLNGTNYVFFFFF